MMRSVILLVIFLSLLSKLSAQEVGVRAGMDLYKFHYIESNFEDVSDKWTASPSFGFSFRMPFKERSAFRTGLFYSNVNNETAQKQYRLSQQFLKIPVQYGFTVISEDIRSGFFFGPNLGYGLKGEYLEENTSYNIYKDQSMLQKRLFLGFGAGIRVEYLGICFEAQYNADFLIPDEGYGSGNEILGHEIISFWLGYSYSFAKKSHRYSRRK